MRWIKQSRMLCPFFTSWVPWPEIVWSRKALEDCSKRHILHEYKHILQFREHGNLGMRWRWLVLAVRHRSVHKRHPFEVEARAYAHFHSLDPRTTLPQFTP